MDETCCPGRIVGESTGRMRVHADRQACSGPYPGDHVRPLVLLLVIRRNDDERSGYAGGDRAVHDLCQVGLKLLAGKMAVGIDHRIREPGAMSLSNATSTGLPPSGLAARIIPFDSIPISFAGFRLNTTPTVRPTSCSGS